MFFWTFVAKKIGRKYTYYAGAIGWALTELGLFFITPPVNVPLLIFVLICRGFFGAVAYLIPMSLLPDVIQQFQQQVQVNHHSEGLLVSIFMLMGKLSQALMQGICAYVLGAVGFESPVLQTPEQREGNFQPPEVLLSLRILVCIVPIPCILLSNVFLAYIPEQEANPSRCSSFRRLWRKLW